MSTLLTMSNEFSWAMFPSMPMAGSPAGPMPLY
jgi:hypothetical protein